MFPIYTFYIAGFPNGIVEFLPTAAKEMGINIQIKYHGCCVETLYQDKSLGLTITDASIERLKYEDENQIANQYYTKTIGEDWLQKLENRAKVLCEENYDPDALPF